MKKPCGHLDVYVKRERRQSGCTYNPKKLVRIHHFKRKFEFRFVCVDRITESTILIQNVSYKKLHISRSNVRQSVWSSESRCILRRVGRDNSNLRACEWTWKKFLASKCSREKCVYWGFVVSERTLKAHIYCRVNCFFLLQN